MAQETTSLVGVFTRENIIKTLKGAAIAGSGAAGLFLLNYLGTLKFDDPVLASFMVWVIPTAVNALKEFLSDR